MTTEVLSRNDVARRADAMQVMPLSEREWAIAMSNNVVGYERFLERRINIDLRHRTTGGAW